MFNIGRNKKIEELEKIIDEYQDQLYSFAFYRVGSFDVAQDIVQDAFIKLYHNYPKLSEVRNIKSYLMKIISNKCIDYKRQLKHPLSLEAALLKEDESARPFIEEFFSINDVLRELPDEQSEVVTMHLVDDLSFVEISSILEISVNTIKSRYKYAIEKLKNHQNSKSMSTMNNLSPKNKPVAPKSLKVNVINQLKHEKRMKRIFLLKSFSAAAAVIIVITVLAPFLISSNAKANSKEYISAAIDKIIHSNNLSIKFMVRTDANENFSYINPQNEFISTTFLRSFEAPFLWRIEKQNGRTALFNGEKIYIWNNGSNVGYINGKEGESGILEDYYTLLEPQNLLQRELAALSAKSVKASYESNDSIISLTISTNAQGSFENSYLLNSSIAESNSKRTYIFDKKEKFLKAFTIDIKVKDRYITIVKSIEIKYSEMLDWSKLNSIPNIEWKQISQINENVSLKNISADQAAKFILSSLERSDFNSVSEAFTYYDAKFIKENYCGLKVISIGKSFKSGLYPGEFVPCTVVLKNGKRASTNIALRNDNQNKVWCIDGGI